MMLENLLSTYGLPGIFVGVAIEGEAVAFLGGTLAHHGVFPVEAAALAASLGASLSDNGIFALGRFGRRLGPVRRTLDHAKIVRLNAVLERHPIPFVLGCRFVYGMRTASLLLIGTTGISWLLFSSLNLVAVLIWAHLVTWLGYAGGLVIERLFGDLAVHHRLIIAVFCAMLVAVLAVVIGRSVRRRALPAIGEDGR